MMSQLPFSFVRDYDAALMWIREMFTISSVLLSPPFRMCDDDERQCHYVVEIVRWLREKNKTKNEQNKTSHRETKRDGTFVRLTS